MIGRNDDCWCLSGKKWKKCHYPDVGLEAKKKTEKEILKNEYFKRYNIFLKNTEQIDGIRKASQLAAFILEETCKMAKEGVTTLELNDFAHELHMKAGAIPAPLNYGSPPFPKSICTSLNEVVCHGIPDNKPLKKGDILNIDVTSILDGYYGDCSKMVMIGDVTPESKLVIDVAYNSLMKAIEICKPGVEILQIGNVIEEYAKTHKCSVVHQFVGHGVGLRFHENPQVAHCYNSCNVPMAPGMIFTIEPMINAGVREAIVDSNDEWTARTKDGKMSAQFEHTILITEESHEILTNWKR
jgi:methionyl aminopeptidase